ncbi:MAG TPA: hypothetical protein VI776_07925 [Anaerolineales bacterium]|nr:hypothetical protein [Anaerolineales bacterium]
MNTSAANNNQIHQFLDRIGLRRGLLFGVIIIFALIAFEIFNYSTTVFALSDLLGDLEFLGLSWAAILAIAFCGIDFAGIARLFTPEDSTNEPNEVWYLFGAWLLAATMNAMLTWWGVSIALLNQESLGNAVVERETLLKVVPIFVAILVWLIRVLIIGSFSVAGDRLFSQADRKEQAGEQAYAYRPARSQPVASRPVNGSSRNGDLPGTNHRPAYKPNQTVESGYGRPEPTYHPPSVSARGGSSGGSNRNFPSSR